MYFGSRKGSRGAPYELTGDDFDLASLLSGLLRVAHVAGRAAAGQVTRFEIEKSVLTL